MTNIKNNNRFSSLLEETKNLYDNISYNDKYDSNNTNNRFQSSQYNKFYEVKQNKVLKPKLKVNILDENQFPTLSTTSKQTISSYDCKYSDKIKQINININENIDKDNFLLPGWITMERDSKTNKTIIKDISHQNKLILETSNIKEIINTKEEELNIEEGIDILICLYEKRTEDYINLWGEYEYDKVFLFPNYDYDYFDRLDWEEYEKEKKLNQTEMNNYEIYSE